MIRKLLIAVGLLFSTAAQAEWREASTPHFLVYSEGGESQLREFATKLEKFHFILRTMHNVTREPPPIRLKVYLVRNIDAVGETFPTPAIGIGGYYIPRARGPIVVGARGRGGFLAYQADPDSILLHEYAHHFMHAYFPATYPTWYVEGFAEFWGTTRILENDVVEVGHAAFDRFSSFGGNRWSPIDRVLAARSYADARGNVDLIYAQGWLLLRYLFENRERSGQLERYLNAVNAGRSYEQAMDEAFGEGARELNRELMQYAGNTQFRPMRIPFRPIAVGDIQVRRLRPAENALIDEEIRLSQGITARYAASFVAEVRDTAARFPEDPYAQLILTEVERIAGNHVAAAAAVDRLLRIEPNNPRALMYKGLIETDALRAAGSADEAAWTAAREFIVRAVRTASNDPLVLQAFFDSYTAQGVLPPAPAQNALFRALELAPGDEDLRYKVAADFERRNMIREAAYVIRPSALEMREIGSESERQRRRREELEERYREVGTERRETPREMLTRLEALLAAQPAPERERERETETTSEG